MLLVERVIRSRGGFCRRRDLLAVGCSDAQIRAALAAKCIFRVRQGWYSVPDAVESAIRAVRVGGRLTGIAALETYGLPVPRHSAVDIVVPANAHGLRDPLDRSVRLPRRSIRLKKSEPLRVHWTDAPRHELGSTSWRVSMDEALVVTLLTEERDIAVACCSAVMRVERWSQRRMDAVFARVRGRARAWRSLVNRLDGSHGETFVRLWAGDAGIHLESQPPIGGGRRCDFKLGKNTFIEVDGAQHDPAWKREKDEESDEESDAGSTWQDDHRRDTEIVAGGGQVLRWTYLQLYAAWEQCLAALERAHADDLELEARRLRHPSAPRSVRQFTDRKRRRARVSSV